MHQLLLLRHAKSAWDDPQADDFDRPLNARGQASAQAIGDWLRHKDLVPDMVLCSAARRTVETWERMMLETEVKFSPGLYHAGEGKMLAALQSAEGKRVMLIGHNPGMAVLATTMVRNAPVHPCFAEYPTAALTVMELDIKDWSELKLRRGLVQHFITPRELLEAAAE